MSITLSKTKNIALALFLLSAILLIINMYYKDPFASVYPLLGTAKLFFYFGTLGFVACLILVKDRSIYMIIIILSINAFSISLFYNVRLSKLNYDRIQKEKRLSEYYEIESCSAMEKRFAEDIKNKELKYFTFNIHYYSYELDETLEKKFLIENFFIGDTELLNFKCYNKLVEKHLEEKYETEIMDLINNVR